MCKALIELLNDKQRRVTEHENWIRIQHMINDLEAWLRENK